MTKSPVTVLGGGNTAFSVAANLSLAGASVTLCELSQFEEAIGPIRESRQILLEGVAHKGAATLNRMGREYIRNNHKTLRLREMTSVEPQKMLRFPQGVTYHDGLLYVCDFGSHRVQVFRKDAEPLTESQIIPEPRSPTLMTT